MSFPILAATDSYPATLAEKFGPSATSDEAGHCAPTARVHALLSDLAVRLGCSDRVSNLLEEGIDCAIRGGSLEDSTMVARHVADVSGLGQSISSIQRGSTWPASSIIDIHSGGLTELTTKNMPILFIGHGYPMNAITDNGFTRRLAALGGEIPRPKAVLCISAHWMTEGTWVTGIEKPKTIHDFYGVPPELFAVEYPAPGSPAIAKFIADSVTDPQVHVDTEAWGLDHGAWSVLRHMYPKADVPVVQLSIHMEQPAETTFNWAGN